MSPKHLFREKNATLSNDSVDSDQSNNVYHHRSSLTIWREIIQGREKLENTRDFLKNFVPTLNIFLNLQIQRRNALFAHNRYKRIFRELEIQIGEKQECRRNCIDMFLSTDGGICFEKKW